MIILKSQVVLTAVAKPQWKEHEETETNKMLPLCFCLINDCLPSGFYVSTTWLKSAASSIPGDSTSS